MGRKTGNEVEMTRQNGTELGKGLASKAKSVGFISVTGSQAEGKPAQIFISENSGKTDRKRYWR